MKNKILLQAAGLVFLGSLCPILSSCEDDVSAIGSGMVPSEVNISVDSTTFDLKGHVIEAMAFDSRSTTTLIGSINTPEFGRLRCSYVTQLLPSESISIPDSISPANIDSVRMILRVPRALITGDSLSPQQATVYRLTEQLPKNILSNWNPEGKYSPTPLGKSNYTLSAISMGSSANISKDVISLRVPMPKKLGEDALRKYREDPSLFLWPQDFAKEFPGLYITSTFGKGCIASVTYTQIYVYTHHNETVSEKIDSTYVTKIKSVRDSTCFFTSAPEVLSSNIIDFTPSETLRSRIADGEILLTSPGGYHVSFTFPAEKVLEEFRKKNYDLAVINNLSLSIPGEKISNDLGIDVPPTLLLIQKMKVETFFAENKVPDNITSFIMKWNSTTGKYTVSSMRPYIMELNSKDTITEEDTEFVVIPVSTKSETVQTSDDTTIEYTTSCEPYLAGPTIVKLNIDKSTIVFTFSNQKIM